MSDRQADSRYAWTDDLVAVIMSLTMVGLLYAGIKGHLNQFLLTMIVLVHLIAFVAAVYWTFGRESTVAGLRIVDRLRNCKSRFKKEDEHD